MPSCVVMKGDVVKLVELLVGSGQGVDPASDYGQAILLLAAATAWFDLGETISEQGRIQFLLALYHGNQEEANRIAEQFCVYLRAKDRSLDVCALFLAVKCGHVHTMESLLQLGVDVDSGDTTGQTSLHEAN